MFYKKKKKKKKKKYKSLSFETFNLLRSHTECGVYTHTKFILLYIYLFIYLLIIIFISYDKKTQLFNIIH